MFDHVHAVRELIPSKTRLAVYGLYLLAVVVVGSFDASGVQYEWIEPAMKVLFFLSAPVTTLAGLNVDPDAAGQYEQYTPRYAEEN